MKRGLKGASIWIVGVVLITLMVNLVAFLFVRFSIYAAMPSFIKYAKIGEAFLYPQEYVKTMEKPEKINAILTLRSLLSDNCMIFNQGIKGDLTCTSIRIDSATTFSSKNGESELSSGAWMAVCEEQDGRLDTIKNTVGLLSVENLCELDGVKSLYDGLKANPDAKIRLDSYGINDYIVEPVEISLVDENGGMITKYERSDVPENLDIVTANNLYINSANDRYSGEDNLYNKMTLVYGGEGDADRLCKEAVSKISYGKDYTAKPEINWGFGRFCVTDVCVVGDYSMVQVQEYIYIKTVFIYTILLNVCWTIGMILLFPIGHNK